MLCRTILTAIVISCTFSREIPLHARGQGSPRIVEIKDVICVLLLSGLQKEDLDANTMEKLRRHNVNIYDMNNEKLRQECLLKSLGTDKTEDFSITTDRNDASTLSVTKQTQKEEFDAEVQNSDITKPDNYFADKTNLQSLIDEIKMKGMIQTDQNRNNNFKDQKVIENTEDKLNLTIIDENRNSKIEYLQSQPTIDSVIKFWSKLTHRSNPEKLIKFTTTLNPPYTQEEIYSTVKSENKVYVHSREMEYINRVMAEYLASQTVPTTTTELITRKGMNLDNIYRKIKELLVEKNKEEVDPIAVLKNLGAAFDLRTLSEITDFSGPIRINNKNRGATRKSLRITSPDRSAGIIYNNRGPSTRLENAWSGPVVKSLRMITADINDENREPHIQENLSNINYNIRELPRRPADVPNDSVVKPILMASAHMNYNNNELPRRPEDVPNDPIINVGPRSIVKNRTSKLEAINYLNNILRLNKASMANKATITYSESTTQESVTPPEEQPLGQIGNKDIRYNNEDLKHIIKDFSQREVNNKGMASGRGALSADVILRIAEQVKEIVLKDIRRGTTEVPITVTTSSPTTTSTVTTSTTEVPDVLTLKDTENGKHVLQTLMELLKEYKTISQTTNTNAAINATTVTLKPKDTTLTLKSEDTTIILESEHTSPYNIPLVRMFPPIMAGLNPYEAKAQMPSIRDMRENPYKQNFVQIPLGPADRALQAVPYNPIKIQQINEHRILPITIQTNSIEVAPLPVPLSKPIPLINQQIIVTTPNPLGRNRGEHLQRETKQRINNKHKEVLNVSNESNHHLENPTYADLTKNLHLAENIKQEFRDSYKDRIQKLKERIKFAHEHNREKVRELSHALPSYHGELKPNMDSNHNAPLHQSINTNRHDEYSRLLESNHRGTYNQPMNHVNLNRPLNLNHHEIGNRHLNSNHNNLNRPLDQSSNIHEAFSHQNSNHPETFNRPLESNRYGSLNRHVDLNQYAHMNRPEEPSQRDIITREVLSRLVGLNHHDVISHLVEPSAHDLKNRPGDLNQQSRSHHSDAYERIEHEQTHPRYKGARFHEELERIESLPRNSYDHKMQSNCCNDVAARQQMPLTKVRQRGRYDDSHFKNFLKSQQKVTEMLEKILAAKTKQEAPSAEIR